MKPYRLRMAILCFIMSISAARAEAVVTFYSRDLQLRGLGIAYPHAFFLIKGVVGIDRKPVAIGYGFTAKRVTPAVWVSSVPGKIWLHKMSDAAISKKHVSVTINGKQYTQLIELVSRWNNITQPSYSLNSQNCVTFIREAALLLGLPAGIIGKYIKNPKGYLDDLSLRVERQKGSILAGTKVYKQKRRTRRKRSESP